jgi:hypothetical protein
VRQHLFIQNGVRPAASRCKCSLSTEQPSRLEIERGGGKKAEGDGRERGRGMTAACKSVTYGQNNF